MKILFLNHNLAGRGTYFRCMGFARELVKLGHSVDLWTCSREPSWKGNHTIEDGVCVWQTPRWAKGGKHDGGYAPVDIVARLFQSVPGNWDIVHAFDHRPNVLLPWYSLRAYRTSPNSKSIFLADWCDWWAGGGITTARRRFAFIDRMEQRTEEGSKRMADGVTVISSVLEHRALNAGVQREKLLFLPSGVDIERFPLLDKAECRQKLGLPPGRPLLGFVGFSLWDMELLADTFERIRERIPTSALLVIGGGVEEAAKTLFRHRFAVGTDVFLPGVVPFSEIPAWLGACDIQLLPMNNSTANLARLPNKLCDYMASGRPIVASDVGDSGSVIKILRIGEAVPGGAEAMAESCIELISNPAKATDFGRRARQAAENKFAYSRLIQRLSRFYEEIFERIIYPQKND